jgi:hypothetical protein
MKDLHGKVEDEVRESLRAPTKDTDENTKKAELVAVGSPSGRRILWEVLSSLILRCARRSRRSPTLS